MPGSAQRRGSDESRVCFISLAAYAYFVPESKATPGGAERQLYLVGQQLADSFDVHFLVGDYGQAAREQRDGVTLHRAYEPAVDASPYRRLEQLYKLYRAMRRVDADVYVFRGEQLRGVITYGLATALRKRWVYNLARDSQTEAPGTSPFDPKRVLFRWVLRDADGVVVQTPYQHRRLQEQFGVDATIVPNGYPDVEDDVPYDEREFFLYVGRIESEQKRPHLFLELARELPRESFVLVGPRAGEEKYCDRIEREANALENVEYVGEVDPTRVHDYYARAIALVNTSNQEGFPNTFLEAWRLGTPVLGLDVDPGRFLEDESIGFANSDFESLVALTTRMADSVEHRRMLGERSRRYFEQNYHISVTADRYAGVLRYCLE